MLISAQRVNRTQASWTGLVAGKLYNISVQAEDGTGAISKPTTLTVSTGKSIFNTHADIKLFIIVFQLS